MPVQKTGPYYIPDAREGDPHNSDTGVSVQRNAIGGLLVLVTDMILPFPGQVDYMLT